MREINMSYDAEINMNSNMSYDAEININGNMSYDACYEWQQELWQLA